MRSPSPYYPPAVPVGVGPEVELQLIIALVLCSKQGEPHALRTTAPFPLWGPLSPPTLTPPVGYTERSVRRVLRALAIHVTLASLELRSGFWGFRESDGQDGLEFLNDRAGGRYRRRLPQIRFGGRTMRGIWCDRRLARCDLLPCTLPAYARMRVCGWPSAMSGSSCMARVWPRRRRHVGVAH